MGYTGTDWKPAALPGETDDFTLDFVGELIPGAPIASLTLVSGGVGYGNAVQLVIGPPGKNGAQATATAPVSGGVVGTPVLGQPGSQYLQPPPVSVIGSGSGAAIVAVLGAAESVANVVSVVVTDLAGIDPSAQTRAVGAPSVNGSQVTQRMVGMVAGANYRILVTVNTSNGRVLELYSHVACAAAT